MIEAEIHRKAPVIENMEDVLTSNVFGLLKYVDSNIWFPTVLSSISDLSKELGIYSSSLDETWGKPIIDHKLSFWKRWSRTEQRGLTEPDLISQIEFDCGSGLVKRGVIVWEMKYHSYLGHDQLARELDGLINEEIADVKMLVHLAPAGGGSLKDFKTHLNTIAPLASRHNIPVLSYTWEALRKALLAIDNPPSIIEDLIRYLAVKGFDPFEGFFLDLPPVLKHGSYRFKTATTNWNWQTSTTVNKDGAYKYE